MKTPQAQSPSASRPPPVFPDDLIVEILTWLPVKSLVKLRCVCKSWKSLISDPNFVKLHLHRSARNPNLLLVWENYLENEGDGYAVPCSVRSLLENPSYTIEKDDCYRLYTDRRCTDRRCRLVGSCNGVVCLFGDSLQNEFLKNCFYLCNPATKLTSNDLACLPVGDTCYYYSFAFGCDNLSDTYKVLAFGHNYKAKEESQKKQVKICSLGDNSWRNVSFPLIPFHNDDHNNGVYFNGTLNWLALCNIKSGDYEWDDTNTITIAQMVIISFDLGMETCTQLLLPCLDEAPPVQPTIGVLMDCLCFSHDSNRTHFVVWQMKEFGVEKSWTQFMKVSYQDLQTDFFDFYCTLLPLCKSENGDILMIASAVDSQATLYHRRDNRVERTVLPDYILWNETMDYVESLVLPCCKQMLMMRHKDGLEHSRQGSTDSSAAGDFSLLQSHSPV